MAAIPLSSAIFKISRFVSSAYHKHSSILAPNCSMVVPSAHLLSSLQYALSSFRRNKEIKGILALCALNHRIKVVVLPFCLV